MGRGRVAPIVPWSPTWAGPRGTPREVIAALEAAVPRLLDDPQFRTAYTANGLQPGFLPHDQYVRFLDDFARQTEGFLRDAGVIR